MNGLGIDFGSTEVRVAFVGDSGTRVLPNIAVGPDHWGAKRCLGLPTADASADEVVSARLLRLRAHIESELECRINCCVIAVPPGYGVQQRSTLRTLATTSGLGDVALVDDTVATCAALRRREEISGRIVIMDIGYMGASRTQIQGDDGQLTAVGHSDHATLGDRSFDARVVDLIVSKAARGSTFRGLEPREREHWIEKITALRGGRPIAEMTQIDIRQPFRAQVSVPEMRRVLDAIQRERGTLLRFVLQQEEQRPGVLVMSGRSLIEFPAEVLRAARGVRVIRAGTEDTAIGAAIIGSSRGTAIDPVVARGHSSVQVPPGGLHAVEPSITNAHVTDGDKRTPVVSPDDPLLLKIAAARALVRTADPVDVLNAYAEAVSYLSEEAATACELQAKVLLRKGDSSGAEQLLEHANARFKGSKKVYEMLSELQALRAVDRLKKGDLNGADEWARTARKLNPKNQRAQAVLAELTSLRARRRR